VFLDTGPCPAGGDEKGREGKRREGKGNVVMDTTYSWSNATRGGKEKVRSDRMLMRGWSAKLDIAQGSKQGRSFNGGGGEVRRDRSSRGPRRGGYAVALLACPLRLQGLGKGGEL
jgi:hypothetical protein